MKSSDFTYRAARTLATYETYHGRNPLPSILSLVENYKALAWSQSKLKSPSPRSSDLVESMRNLPGGGGETPTERAPKPPKTLGRGRGKKKRGGGRASGSRGTGKQKAPKGRKAKAKKATVPKTSKAKDKATRKRSGTPPKKKHASRSRSAESRRSRSRRENRVGSRRRRVSPKRRQERSPTNSGNAWRSPRRDSRNRGRRTSSPHDLVGSRGLQKASRESSRTSHHRKRSQWGSRRRRSPNLSRRRRSPIPKESRSARRSSREEFGDYRRYRSRSRGRSKGARPSKKKMKRNTDTDDQLVTTSMLSSLLKDLLPTATETSSGTIVRQDVEGNIRRREFVAAASRLPEGDV